MTYRFWTAFAFLGLVFSLAPKSSAFTVGVGRDSAIDTVAPCLSGANLTNTIKRLAGPLSDSEFDQVKALLFSAARKSQQCRHQVITTLMSAMGQGAPNFFAGQAVNDTWTYGAEVLGELKATQALELLISHLSSTDGLSTNMNHFPAVGAVIEMGTIAIPKLAAALRENPDRYIRRYAIVCLGSIGGGSAKNALKQALPLESDRCNREFIEASLKAFKNKRTPNRIVFDPERATWYAKVYCQD